VKSGEFYVAQLSRLTFKQSIPLCNSFNKLRKLKTATGAEHENAKDMTKAYYTVM